MSARTKAAQADEQFRAALAIAQAGDAPRAMKLLDRTLMLDARHRGVRNALGVLRLESGDVAGAISLLKPLARDVPDAAGVQLNLGNALVAAGRANEAIAPLKRATALDPNSALAWYGYARALQTAGRAADAVHAYRVVLQHAPAHVESRASIAAAHNFLDEYVEAEREAREAIRLMPSHAGAHLNLSVALLAQHRWAEGWAEYEWRERTALLDGQRRSWARPRWDGGAVAGRTVLVHAEQGYGDTLQFVRYLPALRALGTRVVLQCPAPLVALLEHAVLADEVIAFGDELPPHDVQLPLTGLPLRLCCDSDAAVYRQDGPYLSTVPSRATSLPERTSATELRVGLVWAGSGTHVNDMHRSCGLDALRPLWDIAGVSWFSLQAGPRASDLKALPKGIVVHDLAPQLHDFADTAAAIAALDMVISVDSAVAHLAGALGRPCLMLAPRVGLDWRWANAPAGGEADGSGWYRSLVVVRQAAPSDWSGAVAELGARLARLATTSARV